MHSTRQNQQQRQSRVAAALTAAAAPDSRPSADCRLPPPTPTRTPAATPTRQHMTPFRRRRCCRRRRRRLAAFSLHFVVFFFICFFSAGSKRNSHVVCLLLLCRASFLACSPAPYCPHAACALSKVFGILSTSLPLSRSLLLSHSLYRSVFVSSCRLACFAWRFMFCLGFVVAAFTLTFIQDESFPNPLPPFSILSACNPRSVRHTNGRIERQNSRCE